MMQLIYPCSTTTAGGTTAVSMTETRTVHATLCALLLLVPCSLITCNIPTVSEHEQMAPNASAVAVRLPLASPSIFSPRELKKVIEAAWAMVPQNPNVKMVAKFWKKSFFFKLKPA
jgi:hypothetical protein